jgi:flagellar basal-body rod protein FlgG
VRLLAPLAILVLGNASEAYLKELWVPLSGAIAQQRKVETIANNVANANTNGFKKDQVAFKEHLTAYEHGADIDLPNKEWAPKDFYRSYGADKAHVEVQGTYTDFSQGQIRPTNNPLDLALNGKGFLEVLTPNGTRYTRNGTLGVNNLGQLVTQHGYRVLTKLDIPEGFDGISEEQTLPKPQERFVQLGKGPISINHQGQIFQNNQLISELNITEFKTMEHLKKEGHSLFINDDIKNIKKNAKTMVIQGSIETSNVNPIKEMSNLIKAHRNFESIQKVIKTYDSMASKAYNEIGKF